MSKYGTIVLGPAGAGKTTFCAALLQHLALTRRPSFYINLDPAATTFPTQPDLDITSLISLPDAMTELQLGPNGGLLYCLDFLLDNLDWLDEAVDPLPSDTLIVIDLPGQIELYTHVPVIPRLVQHLGAAGALDVRLCAAYLLEATSVVDRPRFFAGALSAMSAMLLLEIPHLNLLSKMDLAKGLVSKRELRRYLDLDPALGGANDPTAMLAGNHPSRKKMGAIDVAAMDVPQPSQQDAPDSAGETLSGASFARLNSAVAELVEQFGMVSFLPLDAANEDSIATVLAHIDDAVQFHEAQEPKEPRDDDQGDDYEGDEME